MATTLTQVPYPGEPKPMPLGGLPGYQPGPGGVTTPTTAPPGPGVSQGSSSAVPMPLGGLPAPTTSAGGGLPAPAAPAPSGLAPGWQVGPGGGNMVQNTATGQVVDTNHPIYQQALAGAGGAAATPGGAAGAGSPLSTAPPTGPPTTAAGAFQQALLARLNAPPPSASSPAIAPAIAANKLAEQRGMERSRAQLAERSAAEGTANSGGFDTALTGLNQDRAQREGQFAGNAVMQQATQQANELTQALTLYGNMYSDEQRLAMQEKLANLQAQLQRESLAQQGSLATQQLAQTGELGRGNLNLGLLSALLGNQVSNSSLGLQAGLGQANLNQNAVLSMLGYL